MLTAWLRRRASRRADRLGDAVSRVDLNVEFPEVMRFMRLEGQAVRAYRCPPEFLELVRTTFQRPSDILLASFIRRVNREELFITPNLNEKILPFDQDYVILFSARSTAGVECDLVHELTHFDQFRTGKPQNELDAQANEMMFLRIVRRCRTFEEALDIMLARYVAGFSELDRVALKEIWDRLQTSTPGSSSEA